MDKENKTLKPEDDIMAELNPDAGFHLMRTKRGKIVSYGALIVLAIVIVWCVLYQQHIIPAVSF
jgi:hypothetical protein